MSKKVVGISLALATVVLLNVIVVIASVERPMDKSDLFLCGNNGSSWSMNRACNSANYCTVIDTSKKCLSWINSTTQDRECCAIAK